MNPIQWLKSVTGYSAISSLSSSAQRIGQKPGWPILIENMDDAEAKHILDAASIESWGYFVQPGALPGTITGSTWVTVPRGKAYKAEAALKRNGAVIGGRQLLNGGQQ